MVVVLVVVAGLRGKVPMVATAVQPVRHDDGKMGEEKVFLNPGGLVGDLVGAAEQNPDKVKKVVPLRVARVGVQHLLISA